MYNQAFGMSGGTFGQNFGEPMNNNNQGMRENHNPRGGGIYLEGSDYYNSNVQSFKRVAPANGAPMPFLPVQQFEHGVLYEGVKPMLLLMKSLGILPVVPIEGTLFKVTPVMMIYSSFVGILIVAFIGYLKWDKIETKHSTEGKFEEAVIDYLFTVYLFPILLIPLTLFESRKTATVMTDWGHFENVYKKMVGKRLPLHFGNKPLVVTIALPVISCGTMVVNHVTMVHFSALKVIPYCYINLITYLIGGMWYLNCDVVAEVGTLVANEFENALRNIGPSQLVADYRGLWMLLSKITRNIGMASSFTMTFLVLYLFLIITLTIYGLLSQIQAGLNVKDVGLVITAGLAIALLYFISDKAHSASNAVKVVFQKKLMLVELSWMNEEAQEEIEMFLRATEMSETSMSIGGFFDVNRGLFKSLLATMVTYLVVLLQFQISLPEEASADDKSNSTLTSS